MPIADDVAWQASLAAIESYLTSPALDERVKTCEAAIVRWRLATPGSTFYWPIPFVARTTLGQLGQWCDGETDSSADRVGLDVQGRPVLMLEWPSHRPRMMWRYQHSEGWEVEETDLFRNSIHRLNVADDRALLIGAGGRPGYRRDVGVLSLADGDIVRIDGAFTINKTGARAMARTVFRHGRGGLEVVREISDPPPAMTGRSLAQALEAATRLQPEHVLWDGRLQAPEPWPDQLPMRPDQLAQELTDAILARVPPGALAESALIDVRLNDEEPLPLLPPSIRLVTADALLEARRSSPDGLDLLDDRSVTAVASIEPLDLADLLTKEGQQLCRILSTSYAPHVPDSVHRRGAAICDALADQLVQRIADAAEGSGAVPLIHLEDERGYPTIDNALRRAQRAVGKTALDALLRIVDA